MKKVLLLTGAITLIGLCACGKSSKEVGTSNIEKNFTYQALQGIAILSSEETLDQTVVSDASTGTTDISVVENGSSTTETEAITVTDIISQVDLIMNNSFQEMTSVESDKENYLYCSIISLNDYNQTKTTYKLYYNDIVSKTEVEDDESETEVYYEGIAVIDGLEYPFTFNSEEESEENEQEIESEFKITTDETSYISVKTEYEYEGNEVEEYFAYTIVENGIKTLNYKVNYEVEDDKTETIIIYNEKKIKMSEYTKDSIEYILIEDATSRTLYSRVIDADGNISYILA